MFRYVTRTLVALAFLAALVGAAPAHEYKIGTIEISHPWSRATAPGAPVAGGYLTLKNTGSTPDRLIGGSLEGAERTEIHEMKMDGDVMMMAKVPGGLEIPAGGSVALKPGGLHMMFFGLREALKEGENVKGTLLFEKAGAVTVEFSIEKISAKDAGQNHSSHSQSSETQ
jgi:periplasmic copper chaperone A